MHDLLATVAQHGYVVLAAVVFLMAVGVPLPGALALLTAGSAAAYGKLSAPAVFASAVAALLAGDTLLFLLGRYTGWGLLGYLCRLSANPESCILRSAEMFYRRGKGVLMIAKFLPGLNVMAPPLAGSMKMRVAQFLRLDFVSAGLYVLAYGGLGFLFSGFLRQIADAMQSAARGIQLVLAVGLAVFVLYRVWLHRKYRRGMVRAPRCRRRGGAPLRFSVSTNTAEGDPPPTRHSPDVGNEAAASPTGARLNHGDGILIVDVRSHGYYDENAVRIKGSVRVEPNHLARELKGLPAGKELYLYCT